MFCGIKTPRIIGGDKIDISEYPSTVSISLFGNTHICGGTIIGNKWVITAGHCINAAFPANYYSVNINKTKINNPDHVDYVIYNYNIHPNYDESLVGVNDIAILELSMDVRDIVSPINISRSQGIGSLVHTVGWGISSYIENIGITPDHLQYINGIIVSNTRCGDITGIVCFDSGTSSSICNGDSGTGLYDDNDNIIGITSYGYSNNNKCALDQPGGFTDIAYFTEFICNNTDSSVTIMGRSCDDILKNNIITKEQFLNIVYFGILIVGTIVNFSVQITRSR